MFTDLLLMPLLTVVQEGWFGIIGTRLYGSRSCATKGSVADWTDGGHQHRRYVTLYVVRHGSSETPIFAVIKVHIVMDEEDSGGTKP